MAARLPLTASLDGRPAIRGESPAPGRVAAFSSTRAQALLPRPLGPAATTSARRLWEERRNHVRPRSWDPFPRVPFHHIQALIAPPFLSAAQLHEKPIFRCFPAASKAAARAQAASWRALRPRDPGPRFREIRLTPGICWGSLPLLPGGGTGWGRRRGPPSAIVRALLPPFR